MTRITVEDVWELIVSLNHFCFHAGADKFNSQRGRASLPENFFGIASRAEVIEYFRCVNWSVKQAQSIILEKRLKWEEERRTASLDIDVPYSFEFLRNLLIDYADSIGWALLHDDISWVRSQFLDVKPSDDLNDHNWRSVQTVIDDFNRDPDQIALATDLTSFMQVGDIVMRNTVSGATSFFEVKSGTENERILNVISAGSPAEFQARLAEYVGTAPKPEHSLGQLERTLKQNLRMSRSSLYRESGGTKRFDLKTEQSVIVQESGAPEQSWSGEAKHVAEGLAPEHARLAVVDGCLFFEYGRTRHTVLRERFFQYRVSKYLGLATEEETYSRLRVFDVARYAGMLPAFRPVTTCLMALGEDVQSRLLALNDYLIVHLHVPALAEFLVSSGVPFSVRNMRVQDQPYVDPLIRHLFGNNKLPVVTFNSSKGPVDSFLTGGLMGRLLFNFLRPATIVTMYDPTSESFQRNIDRLADPPPDEPG